MSSNAETSERDSTDDVDLARFTFLGRENRFEVSRRLFRTHLEDGGRKPWCAFERSVPQLMDLYLESLEPLAGRNNSEQRNYIDLIEWLNSTFVAKYRDVFRKSLTATDNVFDTHVMIGGVNEFEDTRRYVRAESLQASDYQYLDFRRPDVLAGDTRRQSVNKRVQLAIDHARSGSQRNIDHDMDFDERESREMRPRGYLMDDILKPAHR